MFMRAWTYWIGGYPSEIKIYGALVSGEELELTWAFWIYVAIFFIGTIVAFKF
jgi:hypothetical protein